MLNRDIPTGSGTNMFSLTHFKISSFPFAWLSFFKKITPKRQSADVVTVQHELSDQRVQYYVSAFEERTQYRFKNPSLLIQALKHRSYLNMTSEKRSQSYERLEFLGDAILNLIVTELLFSRFPNQDEGAMTKGKATLVNKKILAAKALELRLGDLILLSDSEEKVGGRQRLSILADILESVIGAVFLDSGYSGSRMIATRYIYNDMDAVLNDKQSINFKGNLLELTQGQNWGIPVYNVIEERGPEHQKEFTIQVFIKNTPHGTGKGSSKKEAEQFAAREALVKLNALKL
jgi:ribonuclease III